MKVIEAKIVVLGSQGVGKTSLVVRYIGKMFSKHISPTIGASFFTCNINVDNARVKLQVWDTAGQERFRSMAPMYYRNANAALLVYDITSVASFVAIQSWIKELQRKCHKASIVEINTDIKQRTFSLLEEEYKLKLQYQRQELSHQEQRHKLEIEILMIEKEKKELELKLLKNNVSEEMILAVVGNKSDLDAMRAVSHSEATQYAASIGAAYCETSALHDQGIDQVFLNTASALLKLSTTNMVSSLRSYDSNDGESVPTGNPTDEDATHTGVVELPAWSIDSIAHGEMQKSMCC